MDALKLIPQVFFDLIARVVPGVVVLILLCLTIPGFAWANILRLIAGGELNDKNVFGFVVISALAGGYILGQLIAPLGKGLETVVSRKVRIPLCIWHKYDYLRMYCPDSGALSAKIRAEYTMQFSLAAAFFVGIAAEVVRTLIGLPLSLLFLGACLVLFISSLYRGYDSRRTFVHSVENLWVAASGRPANQPAPTKHEGVV